MAIVDSATPMHEREERLAKYFETLTPQLRARTERARGDGAREQRAPQSESQRAAIRQELIPQNDPHGQERVVGSRDIMPITFLERGLRAARAVCRVRLPDTRGAPPDFGTAFLVAPGIALTNHHVLRDADEAQSALFEFDAEVDLNWVDRQTRVFSGQALKIFWTDPLLDVTFVALSPVAHDGTPISHYGHLDLLATSGKVISGEYVSIIQHPQGAPKQIVVRENQVVQPQDLPDDVFLYYRADTEPGSSGAPVFNDQWDVVAVHHLAVQARDAEGRPLNRDAEEWLPEQGEEAKLILMNEGVRISAVYRALRDEARRDRGAAELLHRLRGTQVAARTSPFISVSPPEEPVPEGPAFERTRYDGLKGYDPKFLEDFDVPLPGLTRKNEADAAPVSGGGNVLPYTHFSVVMSKSRRFALYTAVNIDGKLRKKPTSDKAWRRDPRVASEFQSDNELYKAVPNESVDLQRGHLVRRLDPVWGKSQKEVDNGNQDTFHYTNAAPMASTFNDGMWGNLEDYVLERAERIKHRVTVFTGPVFEGSDPEYGHERAGGPWQLPKYFWKVVVFIRDDEEPAVAAFRMDQSDFVSPLFERYTPLSEEEARTYQEPLRKIERLAGVKFPDLRRYDRYGSTESMSRPRLLRKLSDITL